jgi:hypothetical protein
MAELTEEQIEFLDEVCEGRKYWKLNSKGEVDVDGNVDMTNKNLTEIPVKFGRVEGRFDCSNNNLTTLKNCPTYINGGFSSFDCGGNKLTSLEYCPDSIGGSYFRFDINPLTDYFKSIKEEDFLHWDKLLWWEILKEYPYLINIGKKYFNRDELRHHLDNIPQTKLYLG